MKILESFAGILVLWLFSSSPAAAQPGVKMHRTQDTTRDKSGWYYAKSTEGHFSVLMPIPFNDFTVTTTDPKLGIVKVYTIGGRSSGGIKFSVTEMGFREANRPVLSGIAESFRDPGTSISKLRKSPNEVYFHVSNKNSQAEIRYLLTEHSLYAMIIESPVAREFLTEAELRMFFNSLKTNS